MTYHDTIQAFLEKCYASKEEVEQSRASLFEQIKQLEETRKQQYDQLLVVSGQIVALEALLDPDVDHNVELPHGKENLEEMYERRLEGQDGLSEEEVRQFREKHAYQREAEAIVGQIHETNTGTGEEATDGFEDPEPDIDVGGPGSSEPGEGGPAGEESVGS